MRAAVLLGADLAHLPDHLAAGLQHHPGEHHLLDGMRGHGVHARAGGGEPLDLAGLAKRWVAHAAPAARLWHRGVARWAQLAADHLDALHASEPLSIAVRLADGAVATASGRTVDRLPGADRRAHRAHGDDTAVAESAGRGAPGGVRSLRRQYHRRGDRQHPFQFRLHLLPGVCPRRRGRRNDQRPDLCRGASE